MIRTVLVPTNANIMFPIPADYVGKEVEVIAFTKEEPCITASTKKE